jgi:hypothetical protein
MSKAMIPVGAGGNVREPLEMIRGHDVETVVVVVGAALATFVGALNTITSVIKPKATVNRRRAAPFMKSHSGS